MLGLMTEPDHPSQDPNQKPRGTSAGHELFGFEMPDKFAATRDGRIPFAGRMMAVEAGMANSSILIGTSEFLVHRKTGEWHFYQSPEYTRALVDRLKASGSMPETPKKKLVKVIYSRLKIKILPDFIPPTLHVNNPFPDVTAKLHCVGNDGLTPGDIEINAYLSGTGDESVLIGTPFEVVDGILRRKTGFKRKDAQSYGDPNYARDVIALDAYMGNGDPTSLEGSSFGEVDRTAYRKLFPQGQ